MPRRAIASVACFAFLAGCADPNVYGTPRTLPRGKTRVVVAGQAIALREGAVKTKDVVSGSGSIAIHHGLSDRLELGGRAGTAGLRADLKWNFLRGDLDLALDPAVQIGASVNGVEGFYAHLPLLLGVNLGESMTVYATPGVVAYVHDGNYGQEDGVLAANGLGLRVGTGAEWRVTKTVAILPEITFMRFFNRGESATAHFGLGLAFGAQAAYGAPSATVVQWEEPTEEPEHVEEIVPQDEPAKKDLRP